MLSRLCRVRPCPLHVIARPGNILINPAYAVFYWAAAVWLLIRAGEGRYNPEATGLKNALAGGIGGTGVCRTRYLDMLARTVGSIRVRTRAVAAARA